MDYADTLTRSYIIATNPQSTTIIATPISTVNSPKLRSPRKPIHRSISHLLFVGKTVNIHLNIGHHNILHKCSVVKEKLPSFRRKIESRNQL